MCRGRQRLGDGEEEREVLVLNAAKHLQRASAIKAFGECVATSADRCGCRGYCCLC